MEAQSCYLSNKSISKDRSGLGKTAGPSDHLYDHVMHIQTAAVKIPIIFWLNSLYRGVFWAYSMEFFVLRLSPGRQDQAQERSQYQD